MQYHTARPSTWRIGVNTETQQLIDDFISGKDAVVKNCLWGECLPGFRHLAAQFRPTLGYETGEIISLAYQTLREYDWSALRTYRGDIPLHKYIVFIVRRRLGKLTKGQAARDKEERPLDETVVNNALGELYEERTTNDNRRFLYELLDTLPDRERRALVYVKLQGHTVEEAAALLNTTPQNVYNITKRAMFKLKQKARYEH